MPKRPLVDHIALTIRVPRGQDGYWSIISDLGADGRTFTLSDIDGLSNVDRRTISDYLKRLVKAGYVIVVSTEMAGAVSRHTYRLGRSAREAPRLRRDGSEYPETARDRMWRSAKMLGCWTSRDLAEATATETLAPVPLETVKSYVKRLVAAGVVQVTAEGMGASPALYRILLNLGAAAPRILRTHLVFDPNSNTVLGAAEAEEV